MRKVQIQQQYKTNSAGLLPGEWPSEEKYRPAGSEWSHESTDTISVDNQEYRPDGRGMI